MAVSFSVDGRRWLQRTKYAVLPVSPTPAATPSAASAPASGPAPGPAPGPAAGPAAGAGPTPAPTPAPAPGPTPGPTLVSLARQSESPGVTGNETADVPVVWTAGSEEARDLVVPLGGRAAKHVRIELEFASTWILISEVAFDSGRPRWMWMGLRLETPV